MRVTKDDLHAEIRHLRIVIRAKEERIEELENELEFLVGINRDWKIPAEELLEQRKRIKELEAALDEALAHCDGVVRDDFLQKWEEVLAKEGE